MRHERIRVGPAGWSYPDWEGRVYPRPHPRGFHPLPYLAAFVDCVEVNATFYAVPAPRSAERWVSLVQDRPDFRFLAKLNRELTHGTWKTPPRRLAGDFQAAVAPLAQAGRLGAVLAQFPFFFRDDERSRTRLLHLVELFRDLPLVLELRSHTFFLEEGLSFLRGLGAGLAHVDLPYARDHPPQSHPCIGDVGYVRLHGRNARTWFDSRSGRDERYDYLYGRDELEGIVSRTLEVARASRETYLVTNNHYGGQAVANALEIRGLLDGHAPLAPQVLRESFPHLAVHTRGEGQQLLF